MSAKGTLIPIGGNEDKGIEENEMYTLDFIQESILSHVVRESGGKKAKVVVIPTASSIPVEVADNYMKAFDKLGCSDIRIVDIRKRKHSEISEYVKHVEEADLVMFSGGDQSRIVKCIEGTHLHEILANRYMNENFVIAGTSAGAMAMSQEMIAGGSSQESLIKGAVKMSKGMGLLPGIIIDTHFIRRGRFGRVAEALAIFPNLLGIGLAEDTGLIIKNRNEFRVIGSGMVLVFDPSRLLHNKHNDLPEGTPISMSNLVVHILANSDYFSISDRKIEIGTLEMGLI
ncbi:MAG: cyanophycinase [Flavobacteriales bacterium]|nr:cyanophycinase [Flavobacteriales bacterium]